MVTLCAKPGRVQWIRNRVFPTLPFGVNPRSLRILIGSVAVIKIIEADFQVHLVL